MIIGDIAFEDAKQRPDSLTALQQSGQKGERTTAETDAVVPVRCPFPNFCAAEGRRWCLITPRLNVNQQGEHQVTSAQRIPSLDGLRGIAAVMVMVFHLSIFFVPQARLQSLLPGLDRAYLAVDLFFVLSGFVMAHVYGAGLASNRSEHWREFAIARFVRIYPLFALTMLAVMAALTLPGSAPPYVSFSAHSLMLQPVLLHQWASGLNWNYATWSISTEAEAYVAFVFAARSLMTGRHPLMIAGGCIAIVTALSLLGDGSLNVFTGISALLRTLAEFALGVLLYRAHRQDIAFPRKWAGAVAVLCFAAGYVARQDFLDVFGVACLTYYAVIPTGTVGRILNSRPAVALGNWSYSIYLWHGPVHIAITGIFAAARHPVSGLGRLDARLLALATALLVIGLSAATYRYFERRCVTWLRRIPHQGSQRGRPAMAADYPQVPRVAVTRTRRQSSSVSMTR